VDVSAEWGIVETVSPKHKFRGYRFFPDKVKGEGFFIAALQKKDSEEGLRMPRFKSAHDAKIVTTCKHLLQYDNWLCLQDKEGYFALNSSQEADLLLLKQYVYLRKTGLPLGTPAKNDWLPAHDVALSIDKSQLL